MPPISGLGAVLSPLKPGWVIHSACGKSWCGVKTSHCGGCHLCFTTPAAFDKHRRRYRCLDPLEAGLVRTTREYECYGFPGKGESEDV
jgi:hypothetical protein